jgi:hypothetical protein
MSAPGVAKTPTRGEALGPQPGLTRAGTQGERAGLTRRVAETEITAAIGAGGMSEVYRATDTKLGREVAIKVLPPYLIVSACGRSRR